MSDVEGIVESLKELEEDQFVPKNVKEKIKNTISILEEETEDKIKVNKALNELDEIADDPNLQAYTRTQVWNIVSCLEKI